MGLIVKARESLLSTTSGYNNYRGILNLCVILLVLSNARAALENIIKYGILVDPVYVFTFIRDSPTQWPAIEIILSLNIFIIASLFIEKLIATAPSASPSNNKQINGNNNISTSTSNGKLIENDWNESTGFIGLAMIVINLSTLLSLPPFIIFRNDSHPVANSVALFLTCVVFLKLVSYHSMMFWCRDCKRPLARQSATTRSFLKVYVTTRGQFEATNGQQQRSAGNSYGSDDGVSKMYDISEPYPRNLNLKNIYYFMVVPTLCYEFEFARTSRIRKHFLLKRTIEAIILSQLMLALIQQWIVPTVNNSLIPFRQMQFSHMLERLLKLAVPNHVIWLISFYLFFHSLLNIQAELTRFADREFYLDWWNSESVNYFWRCWNIPVHKWCARHLYVPLMSLGLSRFAASTAVFFVSAFFHEYLVSVPLQIFRYWAFFGMLMQLPLARFVSNYLNNQFANVAVWITLIIGQPLCILMYYHDYYVINRITA